MGMTVLYIAFGIVALWLLAEVLMQYKARLRWRLLAFTGFVGVVAGVILPSVLVIAVGATAFAVGQTLVTLSFRKGFVAGWALRRGGRPAPGEAQAQAQSRRRRSGGAPAPEPALEVTGLEYADQDGGPGRDAASEGAVFTPQPVPEETGSYGIQSFAPQQPQQPQQPGANAPFASPFTTAEQDAHQYAAYYDQQQGQGGYYPGGEQQVYAAYSDPYIGTGGEVSPAPPYDGAAYPPYADPAQQQYSMDTPPGGVWVPQQRATDAAPQQPYPGQDPQQPQEYPYPYPGNGGGNGEYGGQYRH
ncbi:hypothetical protein ACFVHW_26460 [Streptomyces sp. NPDC127110]|uniref:hypothetical protein n=1 Tax=Streptomyces sp. NPDC127110 TaxID=3345362 RepID=UPI0036375177